MTSGLEGILTSAFRSGHRSYQNTAQNDVNAENPDYSKVRSTQQTVYMSDQLVGVKAGKTIRCTDPILRNNLAAVKTELETLRVTSNTYTMLQGLMGQVGNESETLSGLIGDFFTLLDTPSVQESVVFLNDLSAKADAVAKSFRKLSETVQQLRADADQQIFLSLRKVEELLQEYDDVNKSITKVSQDSARLHAAEDRKDAILLELSTYLEVHQTVDVTAQGSDSNMHYLWGPDGIALVTKKGPNTLTFQPTQAINATQTRENGQLSPVTLHFDALSIDITENLVEGQLGGLLAMRDHDLPSIQAILDRGASCFADYLNQIHNQGTSYELVNELESGRNLDQNMDFANRAGVLRVAIVDAQGVVVDKQDILLQVANTLPLILADMQQLDGVTPYWKGDKLCISVADSADGNKRGIALCGLTVDAKEALASLGLNDLFWGNETYTPFADEVPVGFAENITLNPRILNNPQTFAHAKLNDQQHLSIGETGTQKSDNRLLEALSETQNDSWTFKAAGFWQEKVMRPFDFGRQFMTDVAQKSGVATRQFQAVESGKNIIDEAFFKVKGVDETENRLEQMKWSNYLQNIMTLMGISQKLDRTLLDILRY
ncbi:MAG: FlgK family flagellar hook-associated protein [Holosporaceae bacterium]